MVMAKDARSVDTRQEAPVFFPAGEETLFGIITRPIGESVGTAVLVMPGGGAPLSTNRNRLSVRLCRRLATDGYYAMRFDYHGVGESTGVVERFRLHEPFVDDVVGAVRCIARRGVSRFILVGSCFGARTALSAASAIRHLEALVLISAPIRDFEQGEKKGTKLAVEWSLWQYGLRGLHPRVLRGLLDRRRRRIYAKLLLTKWRAISAGTWQRLGFRERVDAVRLAPISAEFIASLKSVTDRGVPVLIVYGTADEFYEEFRRASASELGRVLRRGRELVEVTTIRGPVHGFMTVESQDAVLELVTDWIGSRRGSQSLSTE